MIVLYDSRSLPEQSRTSLTYEQYSDHSSTGRTPRSARWPAPHDPARRKSGAKIFSALFKSRSPRGSGSRQRIAAVQKAVTICTCLVHRVEYGGLYEEQQKSFHDLVMCCFLPFCCCSSSAVRIPHVLGAFRILASALLSILAVLALLVTRTTFNVASFMGMIMVIGIVAKNGILLSMRASLPRMNFSAEDAMIQAGRRRLRPSP